MKKKKPVYEGKMRLRKGDEVIVISGKDKNERGKVRETLPEEGKVIIDGDNKMINKVIRHRKPRGTSQRAMVKQQLGEMEMSMPMDVSKVLLICPKCHKPSRIGVARGEDGSILRTEKRAVVRVCLECDEPID